MVSHTLAVVAASAGGEGAATNAPTVAVTATATIRVRGLLCPVVRCVEGMTLLAGLGAISTLSCNR
ncbi:hypothetical protein GCM10029964_069800 [Kibdelosporangium lantanae]